VGELWDAITPKLYGYLVNTLRHQQLAEDCLQETWLKAVGALSQFKPRGIRFSAWLFAIARNVCRQHWRDTKADVSLSEIDTEPSDQLSTMQMVEEKIVIETIWAKISEDDQEVLRLRYIGGLSFKEIAAILTISPLTARVRVHRALARSRAFLNHS
jgi:RNA polymerase sigma-70 factor (ECF subfamily)